MSENKKCPEVLKKNCENCRTGHKNTGIWCDKRNDETKCDDDHSGWQSILEKEVKDDTGEN